MHHFPMPKIYTKSEKLVLTMVERFDKADAKEAKKLLARQDQHDKHAVSKKVAEPVQIKEDPNRIDSDAQIIAVEPAPVVSKPVVPAPVASKPAKHNPDDSDTE